MEAAALMCVLCFLSVSFTHKRPGYRGYAVIALRVCYGLISAFVTPICVSSSRRQPACLRCVHRPAQLLAGACRPAHHANEQRDGQARRVGRPARPPAPPAERSRVRRVPRVQEPSSVVLPSDSKFDLMFFAGMCWQPQPGHGGFASHTATATCALLWLGVLSTHGRHCMWGAGVACSGRHCNCTCLLQAWAHCWMGRSPSQPVPRCSRRRCRQAAVTAALADMLLVAWLCRSQGVASCHHMPHAKAMHMLGLLPPGACRR